MKKQQYKENDYDDYDEEDDEDFDENDNDSEEVKVSKKSNKRLRKTKGKLSRYDHIGGKNLKRRKKEGFTARNLIEDQAEEASDDYEEDEDDSQDEIKNHKDREKQYYTKGELERRIDPKLTLQNLENKYQNAEYQDDEDDDGLQSMEEDDGEGTKQNMLPSVHDPRLWQIRVKRGCEKQACMSLMNKSIALAQKGQHLSILSVTNSENVEGFIYIEAFKEIHVKEAIKGLSVILGNKCILVQKEEMPGIYQVEKKQISLERHQWIRIKQGLYQGDLGLVESAGNNKVWVRLIPRIEIQQKSQNKPNEKQRQKFYARAAPKLFFPEQLKSYNVESKQDNELKKDVVIFKKQIFCKGFLYKQFAIKQIQTDNVKPSIEEVQTFATYINKYSNDQIQSDDEDIIGDKLLKKTFIDSNSTDITKGDKIKVKKGDLIDLCGEVIAVENGYVLFKPNMEGIDENLKIEASSVTKYFEAGDQVRVVDGKYKGETGIIIKSIDDDKFCSITLAQSNRELRILTNYLKLKTEIDQNNYYGMLDQKKIGSYQANDLISYNNGKNVGVVLQVQEDYLKIINDQGEIKNIKISDINKKFEKDRKASTIDSERNTLYTDNVVKITQGKYKGRKGVIKYIFKNILFLWDKEFQQSHGIFVENTSNVLILGDEHMKQNQGAGAVAAMNRRVKDNIVGKDVIIIGGEWKGYRGRVTRADDKQAIVELSAKGKQIPIERTLIQEVQSQQQTTRDDISYGGQTVYEAGKTPMQYNTPSYYPHSPRWGTGQSPGYGNDSNHFIYLTILDDYMN